MEEWRDVVGFEGYYAVSNLGRIKRVSGGRGVKSGTIRKPSVTRCGYLTATLSKDGVQTTKGVHRWVAEAFLSPFPEGHEINHKNGDKTDNRVENLEWLTRSENVLHSFQNLGRVAAHGMGHYEGRLTDDDIRSIRARVASGESQSSLARQHNVSQPMIGGIVHRKYWKHIEQ